MQAIYANSEHDQQLLYTNAQLDCVKLLIRGLSGGILCIEQGLLQL